MKTLKFLSFTFVLIASVNSLAISNSCSLLQQALPAELNLSSQEVELYQAKLKSECWWTQAYHQLKKELQTNFQLNIENITEYQAMRFVRRVDYENSKAKEIPVQLTYQVQKSQYQLPNEQKSSIIWDNWIKGILQLPQYRERVAKGEVFDYNSLKRVHVGFFQLSREVGDYAHVPDEGVIKPPVENDNYWWDFANPQDAEEARRVVQLINDHYRSLGLLPNFTEEKLNRILDVRTAVKRQTPDRQNIIEYVEAIYSGQTRANPTHIQNILNFIKIMLNQALQNKHLVWNGNKLMTPAEVAFLAQKFYVGVHPFSEGNGRTSRFIQELILSVMNMPHGASGDLMDYDVLTTFPEYYRLAMSHNIKLMQSIKSCFDFYVKTPPQSFILTDQKQVNYNCRILKP